MKKYIESLIHYEINQGVITQRDYTYVKNQLYDLIKIELSDQIEPHEEIHTPSEALNPILDDLVKRNVVPDSIIARDLFDSRIMNIFASLPSAIEEKYYKLKSKSSKDATQFLYNQAKALNYIRFDRILKNKSFTYQTKDISLQITINLSKPEKDPKDIIAESKITDSNYPKCVLCKENEGFAGNLKRDSRHQHRLIELDLNGTTWYFQYSPYIYYNEHAIVLSKSHIPMKITKSTFQNLLSLVDHFEGYFFGSNADLPIVGGSILSHDHYQGGCYQFPIENAKTLKTWSVENIQISALDWPLSTIRLRSSDQKILVNLAEKIYTAWKLYNNADLNIISHTNDTPHNTVTPVARFKNKEYELDLILRNNRTTEEHPLGIFHPKSDKHHIKKENIGLIEAIGLAILPARLIQEISDLKNYYFNQIPLSNQSKIHKDWFDKLSKQHQLTLFNFDEIIEFEIGRVFEGVLIDCGVFKQNNKKEFIQFIEEIIHEKLS